MYPVEQYTIDCKDFFRTCNVLPFSCTHLALWRGKERQGKRPEVHAKQKGIKNFITQLTIPLNKLPCSRSRSKAWDSPLIRRKSVPSPVSFHPKNRKRSSKTRSRSRSRSQSPVSRRPHRRIRGPPMDDSPILRRNNVPSPPSHKPKLPPMIRRTNSEPG